MFYKNEKKITMNKQQCFKLNKNTHLGSTAARSQWWYEGFHNISTSVGETSLPVNSVVSQFYFPPLHDVGTLGTENFKLKNNSGEMFNKNSDILFDFLQVLGRSELRMALFLL